MYSKVNGDYLWLLMWDDGYVKKQPMFNIQVWKCVYIKISSV